MLRKPIKPDTLPPSVGPGGAPGVHPSLYDTRLGMCGMCLLLIGRPPNQCGSSPRFFHDDTKAQPLGTIRSGQK